MGTHLHNPLGNRAQQARWTQNTRIVCLATGEANLNEDTYF